MDHMAIKTILPIKNHRLETMAWCPGTDLNRHGVATAGF
jgi:hypothetical protein